METFLTCNFLAWGFLGQKIFLAWNFFFFWGDSWAEFPLSLPLAGWAHVVCALYIPEVQFANVLTMEPIVLQYVPHDRFNKVKSGNSGSSRPPSAPSQIIPTPQLPGFH